MILIIGYIWPEPHSSAAGSRSMSLIRTARDAGWPVHFASPARENEHSERLRSLGVRTHSVQPNDSAFDSWIAELRPDYVVFERFMMEEQFGWRVRAHSPDSVRVLDTVDLHFLRRARQESIQKQRPLDLVSSPDALREIAAIYRSDCALLISEFELKLLSDPQGPFGVPARSLREFSFCYDPPPAHAGGGSGFVSIGNFRHEPNADGIRWLQREIWPAIRRRLPAARLSVYGAYPPREIMDLHDPASGFLVLGPAADPFEIMREARVNLAPLRFGAGLKGKIADGWWCGTPCISTSVGAEGMIFEDRFGGLIADDSEGFAQAAFALHEDATLRERCREAGTRSLRERFDHATNSARLRRELEDIRSNLSSYRTANFTGRMLSYHQHRSTEYFSRWIEGKKDRPPKAWPS